MHGKASLDFQINSLSELQTTAISPAMLYGRGVFTTIAVYGGAPFLWEKHWQRLTANAATVGIDTREFDASGVREALLGLILENDATECRARITLFDGAARGPWTDGTSRRTQLLITTAALREVPQILRIALSPFRKHSDSPLANVKSCNYLDNLLAIEDAYRRGYDEAIRLNEKGEIVSAAMANLFWVKEGRTFTPALNCGGLAGTTREYLLENFAIGEVAEPFSSLNDADEIFLTSSGVGVCAASLNENAAREGAMTKKFADFLHNARRR